jgi:hypothetical protein
LISLSPSSHLRRHHLRFRCPAQFFSPITTFITILNPSFPSSILVVDSHVATHEPPFPSSSHRGYVVLCRQRDCWWQRQQRRRRRDVVTVANAIRPAYIQRHPHRHICAPTSDHRPTCWWHYNKYVNSLELQVQSDVARENFPTRVTRGLYRTPRNKGETSYNLL